MISTSFGISRVVSSTRAGIDIRPMIGPSTSPRKRSMIVHAAPKTTWRNSSGQNRFHAIAATSTTKTAATIGRPLSGTISKSGRAAGAGSGGPAAEGRSATSVICPPPVLSGGDAERARRLGQPRDALVDLLRGDPGEGEAQRVLPALEQEVGALDEQHPALPRRVLESRDVVALGQLHPHEVAALRWAEARLGQLALERGDERVAPLAQR